MSNDKAVPTTENAGNELVLHRQSLAEISGQNVLDHPDWMDGEVVVKLFEKRSNLMRRIKAVALKATNKADWIDMGKKPYLGASGAEKVRAELGLKLRIIGGGRRTEIDEKGKYHMFSMTLEISHPALGAIEAIGMKSSRNKFYSSKTRWENGEKVVEEIPQCDIKMEDVEKSAYSNALQRAVTEFCGLRNLTWDEVNAMLGTTDLQNQVAGVEFGKAGKPAAAPSAAGKKFEDTPEKIAAAKEKIIELLMSLAGGDTEKAKAIMVADTRTDDVDRLTVKQVFWYIKQLEKKVEGGEK